jgi:hypothetical protein
MGRPGERYSQNPKTIQNKKRPKRTINETRGCYKAATIHGKPTNGNKQTKKTKIRKEETSNRETTRRHLTTKITTKTNPE